MSALTNIFNPHAQLILSRRCLDRDEQGRAVESPEEVLMRVASVVA